MPFAAFLRKVIVEGSTVSLSLFALLSFILQFCPLSSLCLRRVFPLRTQLSPRERLSGLESTFSVGCMHRKVDFPETFFGWTPRSQVTDSQATMKLDATGTSSLSYAQAIPLRKQPLRSSFKVAFDQTTSLSSTCLETDRDLCHAFSDLRYISPDAFRVLAAVSPLETFTSSLSLPPLIFDPLLSHLLYSPTDLILLSNH